MGSQKREIPARDEIIRNLSPETCLAIQNTSPGRRQIIRDKEHLDFMREQIGKAVDVIVVLSGWTSDRVVDDRFADQLDRKLRDGCQVYLGYGWEDSRSRHDERPKATRALKKLDRLKQVHGEGLHVARFATHEKILITDEKIVIGSNNWLSNSSFRNSESSLAVENRELASREMVRLQQLTLQHELG